MISYLEPLIEGDSRMFKSTWVPVASFVLAVVLSWVTRSSDRAHAARLPLSTTNCTHAFKATKGEEECINFINGVAQTGCDDEAMPAGSTGARFTRIRHEDGFLRSAVNVRNRGTYVPLFVEPSENNRRKDLNRTSSESCCHDIQSSASIRSTITIQLASVLQNNSFAMGAGQLSYRAERMADCNGAFTETKTFEIYLSALQEIDRMGNSKKRTLMIWRTNGGRPKTDRDTEFFGLAGYPDTCQTIDRVDLKEKTPQGVDKAAYVSYQGSVLPVLAISSAAPQETAVKTIIEVQDLSLKDVPESLGD